MNTRRLGVAVAVLGGYLYAIGGSDGHCPLNTVERYDPRQNKWAPVAAMSTRRKHLGCAVFNNLIYAVGGRDDCMELSSAERYKLILLENYLILKFSDTTRIPIRGRQLWQ